MSVSLNFTIQSSEDCGKIDFKDTTGAYSLSNLGGWGAPNSAIGTATAATLNVYRMQSDSTFLLAGTITLTGTYPDDDNLKTEYSGEDFTPDIDFSDGVYWFEYIVTGNDGGAYTLQKNYYKAIKCSAECCYKKLADKYSTCECGCNETEATFLDLDMVMRLLADAECNGDTGLMYDLIERTTKLCSDCGCGCS